MWTKCVHHPESQRISQIPSAVLILLIFISSRNLSTRDRRGRGGPHLRAPGGHASLSDDGLASMGDPERGETTLDGSLEPDLSQCSVTLFGLHTGFLSLVSEGTEGVLGSLCISQPTNRGRWSPNIESVSARGFCLLNGSFSPPRKVLAHREFG